jgi:hypothetical protein
MEVGARRGAHFQPRTSITMTMSPSRQQSRVYEPTGNAASYVQRLFFNLLWLVAFQNPTLAL